MKGDWVWPPREDHPGVIPGSLVLVSVDAHDKGRKHSSLQASKFLDLLVVLKERVGVGVRYSEIRFPQNNHAGSEQSIDHRGVLAGFGAYKRCGTTGGVHAQARVCHDIILEQ